MLLKCSEVEVEGQGGWFHHHSGRSHAMRQLLGNVEMTGANWSRQVCATHRFEGAIECLLAAGS